MIFAVRLRLVVVTTYRCFHSVGGSSSASSSHCFSKYTKYRRGVIRKIAEIITSSGHQTQHSTLIGQAVLLIIPADLPAK